MFSKSVVGIANATAGGWGNLGGGITTLCMPLVYRLFMLITNSENVAWRLCFIIPLVLHLVGAAAAYTGRDLPDGNYKELEKLGAKQKSDSSVVTKVGFSNINAWILTLTYGLCFGVELTMTNIATLYYYEYHAFSQTLSATLASIFGLVNICARSLGGITSDWCNRKYGMRGRIWALWIFQTIEGILCIAMGLVTLGATGPTFTASEDVIGFVKVENDWVAFNGTGITQRIVPCGSLQVEITALDAAAVGALDPRLAAMNTVVLSEPPAPWGNGSECVSNSNTAAAVVVIMFLFSVSVQMAEGLTYGIVPFVSRPALGVVSGMVGAGGNAGAVLTNAAFFVSDSVRTDQGLINMGIMIVVATLSLFAVYFPDQGGMIVKAGGWAYDPQCIKPPAGYKGSDEITLDYHKPDPPGTQAATVIEATPATVTETNESKDASNKI
jgi:NNP family nitrate/nitrite transporter-like MFS transporter